MKRTTRPNVTTWDGRGVANMSRLAGLYRMASHVPEMPAPSSPPPTGATFGPWATHAARCKCNVCR